LSKKIEPWQNSLLSSHKAGTKEGSEGWQEIRKDLEYYRPGLRPFSGLSELERNSRIFQGKRETYIALNKNIFFVSFWVQSGYCTWCRCNARQNRGIPHPVIMPIALALYTSL